MGRMTKPYGKRPKIARSAPKTQKPKDGEAVIRGKDDAPLSMLGLQHGLYQLAKQMKEHAHLRAARMAVYVRYIDEDGQPASVGYTEKSIYPYRSAADEHGA